jgi:hypothetical protein
MSRSLEPRPLGALTATLAAYLITAVVLAGGAHAAQSCAPPKYPGSGYFTSLKVDNTSCATGRKVALEWYHCRTKHGKAGYCHERVSGFSCHEKRVTIAIEFDARVTCHRGTATVVHTYQQNT